MWLQIFSFVVFLSTIQSCPPIVEDSLTRADNSYYRLPNNIQPLKYNITLQPLLDEEEIYGSVVIEFSALENTKNITLEIRRIEIDNSSITVKDSEDNSLDIEGYEYYSDREFYVIKLANELVTGNSYTLYIDSYEGILHTDNGGFYLAKYIDEYGNEKRLATTQFESTNARRAFPCLDEPALKAKFVVNLIRPEGYSSLSNTEIAETIEHEDAYKDVYEETVTMSTYLAAFVVSDFDYVSTGNHRVYARPKAVEEGKADYALHAGKKLLNILADYLNVSYSLSKMDQIAFPDDYFAAGAMENWGLVTYRESYLLHSNSSLTSELQAVATVISHEFGHQWFGNLVTLSWWEYLWLNEGFATYFEYFAAGEMEPSWRLMEQWVAIVNQYALARDYSDDSQPMNYATENPGGGAPSYVSYQKSGAVIRMFEHFLTTEVFKTGLNLYLVENEYQAAVPSDLYSALQESLELYQKTDLLGGLSVSDILQTWDSAKGYPVVNIVRDYITGDLAISQSKFVLNQTEITSHIWYIPLNFAFSSNDDAFSDTTAEVWLTETSRNISSNSYPASGWMVANKQVTGYYRVNYDEINWQRLIAVLNSDKYEDINVLNRAQLIDDALYLARAGRLDYDIALNLTSYLVRETDYVPWYTFLTNLDFLNTMLSGTEEYDTFKSHVFTLLQTAYNKLGLQESSSDSHTEKLNRAKILQWLCKLGESTCREAAYEELQKWKSTGIIIAPNLQAGFFCGSIANGNEADFDFLYSQYEATEQTHSSLRTRIVNGLGCSQDEDVIKKYLDMALNTTNNSTLESKHRTTAFSAVYSSGNFGLKAALDYVKDNFESIKNALSVTTILNGIGQLITTQELLDELNELAEKYPDSASSFTTAISSATKNVEWVTENVSPIQNWLTENAKDTSSSTNLSVNLFVVVSSLMMLFTRFMLNNM